jgi:site-specific DNA-methyltransferase (cytosine-N4-specific)
VWTLPAAPYVGGHSAVGPAEIALRCIAAGCRPGGVVCDPFSGTATTGVAALQLGRRYVGIDLNPAFHDLAIDRLTAGRTTGPVPAERPGERLP